MTLPIWMTFDLTGQTNLYTYTACFLDLLFKAPYLNSMPLFCLLKCLSLLILFTALGKQHLTLG